MLKSTRWLLGLIFLSGLNLAIGSHAFAVEIPPAPAQPGYTPLDQKELEELLGPVALYPDDLLAIVLPASTFPLQIVQAARFRARTPDATPDKKWDDSVVALLNYPEALKKLNDDLDWTWRLGEAVINQQPDVLAAITGFRERAQLAGNLKTDDKQVVEVREKIVYIRPVNERVIYVPYYDPWEVTTYRTRRVYHYYPDPYPVYYYPYDYGYRFPRDSFWGVSTWYNIGWSNHRLHSLHHGYRHHPYYGRSYRDHDRRRSWRHQEPRQYSGDGPGTQIINGQPVVSDDTTWYPRGGHGARPIGGDRRENNQTEVIAPPPAPLGSPIGGQVHGGGGESGVSVPAHPLVNGAPGSESAINDERADEAVVYEGNVNGEQVRVIRRGTNFETRRGIDARPDVSAPSATSATSATSALSATSAPTPDAAPLPGNENQPGNENRPGNENGPGNSPGNDVLNSAAIQEVIERARQQAGGQQAYSRPEPVVDTTRAMRDEQPVVRMETRQERQVEVYSAPAPDSSPKWQQPEQAPQEHSRWQDNPAVQEAISRARSHGAYGNDGMGEDSRRSGLGAPPREERREPAYEAPRREERPEPAQEAPRQQEPFELPHGIPEIRY